MLSVGWAKLKSGTSSADMWGKDGRAPPETRWSGRWLEFANLDFRFAIEDR
jgi:hypothetical protein